MNYSSNKPITPLGQRSQSALTIDNVFRRALKVANPRDPDEIAKALLTRYTNDAQLIKREFAGVPLTSFQYAALAQQVSGPLSSEIKQATDDLERDLGALVSDIQLKDIAPELRGLADAVRNATGMGLDAAQLALDPAQRDRAFAARHTLGDYSRLTRLLGALTACATALYCRVSQSIDMGANLILVSAGEALAAAGVTKTGGLLQIPASELQSRRDAVIGALRRLLGTEENVVIALNSALQGTSTGPASGATAALNKISLALNAVGAQDLRSLLDEGFVTSLLDDLLDRAMAPTPDGLRSLGPNALVTSRTLLRFVGLVSKLVPNPIPANDLESLLINDYVAALKSFADGFQSTQVGYRLPFLARPPLLSYGFYCPGGVDQATGFLQSLAIQRSRLAELVDCLCCTCKEGSAVAAAIAAKLIFDLDRAIDLLCLGEAADGEGKVEVQAASYGYVFRAATRLELNGTLWGKTRDSSKSVVGKALPEAVTVLDTIRKTLRDRTTANGTVVRVLGQRPTNDSWGLDPLGLPDNNTGRDTLRKHLAGVLKAQLEDERQWRQLAMSWTPICDQRIILGENVETSAVGRLLDRAERIIPQP